MKASAPLTILQRCIQSAALNTVIALGLTAFAQYDFASNLVYSQCIGISIWGFIDLGRLWLIPDHRTQWRRLLWLVPLGVSAGYALGTLLADSLLNNSSFGYWFDEPRTALGYLLMSLTAGGAMTYYFMSREQLASARVDMADASAQAEAARRHAAESKLLLLQSQLEPHMLFNTLANLRALIAADPAQAQHMLDRLVDYLRATLNASRAGSHSLRAEFDRLHDYLELMAVRMGPRLQYTLELPAELAELPMPPLLLQPLVENAIKHGLEPAVARGSICVRARQTDGRITLQVQDSGVGLSPGGATQEGFGLAQVRERLATAYGDAGVFELTPADASGTLATISFPLKAESPC